VVAARLSVVVATFGIKAAWVGKHWRDWHGSTENEPTKCNQARQSHGRTPLTYRAGEEKRLTGIESTTDRIGSRVKADAAGIVESDSLRLRSRLAGYSIAMKLNRLLAVLASFTTAQPLHSSGAGLLECFLSSESSICTEEICADYSRLHRGKSVRLLVNFGESSADLNGLQGTIDRANKQLRVR
jgi:hypothetical protein